MTFYEWLATQPHIYDDSMIEIAKFAYKAGQRDGYRARKDDEAYEHTVGYFEDWEDLRK